ncbi:hypothetical protein ACT7LO_003001 [Providencia rettgeri]
MMNNISGRMDNDMEELKCCDCGKSFSENIISINDDVNICFPCVALINNRVNAFSRAHQRHYKNDHGVETMIAGYKQYKLR